MFVFFLDSLKAESAKRLNFCLFDQYQAEIVFQSKTFILNLAGAEINDLDWQICLLDGDVLSSFYGTLVIIFSGFERKCHINDLQCEREPVFMISDENYTNWPVQCQKEARNLKFRINSFKPCVLLMGHRQTE